MESEYFTSYAGPDDIMHRSHKYIKKYMGKSGKWIYVYEKVKDAIGIEAKRKVLESAHEIGKENYNIEKAKSNESAHKQKYQDAFADSYLEVNQEGVGKHYNDKKIDSEYKKYVNASKDVGRAQQRLQQAKKKNKENLEIYNKSIYKLSNDLIEQGKKKIRSLLNNI